MPPDGGWVRAIVRLFIGAGTFPDPSQMRAEWSPNSRAERVLDVEVVAELDDRR